MSPLAQLIHSSPHFRLLLVSSELSLIDRQLLDYIASLSGSVDIYCFPDSYDNFKHNAIRKIEIMKDYSSGLRCASREYEAVVLHNVLHRHTDPLKFLQLVYRSMENSAEIIVLQSKENSNSSQLEEWLENSEFRAHNTIYDLIKDYDVTVAKKLHMWGNGL